MKEVLVKMIEIYEPNGVDWMGFHLTKKNPYTFHHIREKRHGGKLEMINGAILTRNAHDLLNALELLCPAAYDDYQRLFKKINRLHQPITDELWEEIYGMLLELFYYRTYRLKNKRIDIEDIDNKYFQKVKILGH